MSRHYRNNTQRGMMLLEVLIAILIFAIGVLGMVKMQAVSTANSVNSEDRATAALLANDLVAQLWIAATGSTQQTVADFVNNNPAYAQWQAQLQSQQPQLRNVVGTLIPGATSNTGLITITWTRQLGRNVDSSVVITSSDPNATATYSTEVVLQ